MAKIETEKMLIQMVETELEKRKEAGSYKGQFMGQSHFFGYFLSHFLLSQKYNAFFLIIMKNTISIYKFRRYVYRYEGRCGLPTNFDATYCYALGYGAGVLLNSGKTGLISSVSTPPFSIKISFLSIYK